MVRGGARVNSGPPPDPNALTRNRDGADWVRLPKSGRTGDPPEWPPEVEQPSVPELALWFRVWSMPQAVVWEADRALNTVALYVRTYIRSMERGCQGTIITHARTLANELLLTPESLARARYVIKGTPEEEALDAAIGRHPARGAQGSAKTRLHVVTHEDDDEEPAESAPAVDPALDDEPPPF